MLVEPSSIGDNEGLCMEEEEGRLTSEEMFARTVLAVRGEASGCEGVCGGGLGCWGTESRSEG